VMSQADDPEDLDQPQRIAEASTRLAALCGDAEFARKLIEGLPRDPGRVQAILVREVLHSSNEEVILWVERFKALEAQIADLCRFPTPPQAQTTLFPLLAMRDQLGHALAGAVTHVQAHMPPVWPWVVRHYWRSRGHSSPRQPHRPLADPVATLIMVLIVDHLESHGHPPQYIQVADVIKRVFPRERLTAGGLRTRVKRCREEMAAMGIDREARLASVDFFWHISVQKV
jgi:hypothetical protein